MFKKHFKYFILAISSVLFITVLSLGLGLTAYGLGMESRRFAYSVRDHINKIIPKGKYTTKTGYMFESGIGLKVGINPATDKPYNDPNDVAIDMWKDESLASLELFPKPFVESGFDWIAQGGLKDLLAVNYKKTDFYSGTGKWDLTKPETAKWVTHEKTFPFAQKFKASTTGPEQKKDYNCIEMGLQEKATQDNPNPSITCKEVEGKLQTLEVANYKGIEYWDKNKAQSKTDTFNTNFKQLSTLLGTKNKDTGKIDSLTNEEKKMLESTKETDFYKLNYAGAYYRTRIGAIFLVILTPILGALLIGANVFVFIKYRDGLQ